MLDFDDISFGYEESKEEFLVKNLSFHVEKNEFISIIGTSGCGKSTIFRLINKLEKASSGHVLINNQNIDILNNYSSYMPQKDLLFPWRTIRKNIGLPLELRQKKLTPTKYNEKIEWAINEVGLIDYIDNYPKDLSGGMRQRASFARTLVADTPLLLLDEPFSALDALTKISMQQWLMKEWLNTPKTVLFITHDVEEAIFMSNKIFLIVDRPITHMEEYVIDYPYPRNRDILKQSALVNLKEELINKLQIIIKDKEKTYDKK